MILWRLSDAALADALHHAEEITASRLVRTVVNYTGLCAEDRYRIGLPGQAAVCEWLESVGVRVARGPRAVGTGDGHADLLVWREGREGIGNVKTASQPFHRFLMVPEAQYRAEAERVSFYVGCRLRLGPVDPSLVEIHGFMRWEELGRCPTELGITRDGQRVLTRRVLLAQLSPAERLPGWLDRRAA